jgi:hypothetical protein
MQSEGLGWGKYVPSVFEPTPPTPAATPAQIQQLTPGIQQLQPALPPPPPPSPTGTFNPPRSISLQSVGPPLLTLEQKQQILANLTKYQQYGYPILQWNALNPADQALLLQANIHPQGGVDSASAPAASSTASSSGMSTGEVVLIVGGVAAAGVAVWYFGFRKKG